MHAVLSLVEYIMLTHTRKFYVFFVMFSVLVVGVSRYLLSVSTPVSPLFLGEVWLPCGMVFKAALLHQKVIDSVGFPKLVFLCNKKFISRGLLACWGGHPSFTVWQLAP